MYILFFRHARCTYVMLDGNAHRQELRSVARAGRHIYQGHCTPPVEALAIVSEKKEAAHKYKMHLPIFPAAHILSQSRLSTNCRQTCNDNDTPSFIQMSASTTFLSDCWTLYGHATICNYFPTFLRILSSSKIMGGALLLS